MQVTQDGAVAKELGRFPVADGVAEVPDVPLADPALRWAIRIVDTALAVPVYRSGPLGFLPGGPRSHIFGDRIRIHRGGGNLGLDAPDGAPQVLIDHVRDNLPHGFRLQRIDMGADARGRYVLTFRGRYRPLPVLDVALDRVLAAGVEAQMSAMAFHIGFLMLVAAGVTDLTPRPCRSPPSGSARRPAGSTRASPSCPVR